MTLAQVPSLPYHTHLAIRDTIVDKMGTASKVVNVILRVSELISAAVICGIMGHYLHQLDDANGPYSSRVVYSVALAGISIFLSLVLIPPMRYSFFAFPVDFALFIMWMVCFGLLINVGAPRTSPLLGECC